VKNSKDRSHLRLVGEGSAAPDVFDNLDALRVSDPLFETPSGTASPTRLPRATVAFARVLLAWLTDPRFPESVVAVRLLIGLLYRTHEGAKPVRLTTALAGEFGVSPGSKWRAVRELERGGWISVERRGRGTVEVVVLRSVRSSAESKL
jgi:hypothetical protein